MKKLLSMVAAVSMAAVMLTGCGVPANTVHSIDDLNGKSIGVQLGTTGDTYADGIEGATVEKFAKGADAVQALKQGKVDAVIIDSEPAQVFVSKNDDIEILTNPSQRKNTLSLSSSTTPISRKRSTAHLQSLKLTAHSQISAIITAAIHRVHSLTFPPRVQTAATALSLWQQTLSSLLMNTKRATRSLALMLIS